MKGKGNQLTRCRVRWTKQVSALVLKKAGWIRFFKAHSFPSRCRPRKISASTLSREQFPAPIVHCLKAFHLIVIGLMRTAFFSMKSSLGLLLLSALIFSGCSSPTETMRPVTIAGGKVIGIPFGPGGPVPGKADGYEVRYAVTVPVENTKTLVYKFSFTARPGTKLERVVIDDISDEQSCPSMMDESKPWLDENNEWKGETKPYDYKNPLLAWVFTVTPSMRVYRFTITDTAGKKSVLYQVTGYPDFIKAAMRFSWGEKY